MRIPIFWFLSALILFIVYQFNIFDYTFDLTNDKRYSLSIETRKQLVKVNEPITIDLLLHGKLPAPFLRLKSETDQLLQSIKNLNPKISYRYLDPVNLINRSGEIQLLDSLRIRPHYIFKNERNTQSQTSLYPWAIVHSKDKSIAVSLLENQLAKSDQELILESINQLEYKIIDGIFKATVQNKDNIAVLKSHNTSDDIYITDFLLDLQAYYNLAPFDFKAEGITPKKTLENLLKFDVLIISNPTEVFNNSEKFILDQYTTSGGKVVWMNNRVKINPRDLYSSSSPFVPPVNDLGLDDLFFRNQIRFPNQLVEDLLCSPIVLATGDQNNTQYVPFLFTYFPLITSNVNHLISRNLQGIRTRFVSPIDTLIGSLEKTVLLQSSNYSKVDGYPIVLDTKNLNQTIDPEKFDQSNFILGLLLEGDFESIYKNRIHPFEWERFKSSGNSKWVVFSDGNLAENQIERNQPLPLGYDKWTNTTTDNKTLLKNTIHYLTSQQRLLSIRLKNIEIPAISPNLENNTILRIKVAMILMPLFFISTIYGIIWGFRRITKIKH